MGVNLDAIKVLAELEHYGIKYEFAGEEVRIACPFHKDGKESSPSCYVNTQNKFFKCHACSAEGDIVKLLARHKSNTDGPTSQDTILIDLATRYEIDADKIIDISLVEEWHRKIWDAKPLLQELYDRGITDAMIRRYRFGENAGRITIPIYGPTGMVLNVRKYLPGAPGKQKMRNVKGRSEGRWYPIEQLEYGTILLCGGECKAIVAASQLNPNGIGAVTFTHGESSIPNVSIGAFKGKRIIICLDIDTAGKTAARKHANHIRMVADYVGVLYLPLDHDKYPKGDINDFVAREKGDLFSLIETVQEFKVLIESPLREDTSDPISMSLNAAISADNEKIRLRFKSQVAAMDTNPYLIPKDVEIECSKNEDHCGRCPIFLSNVSRYTIPRECPSLLEFIASPSNTHIEIVKKAIGIPIKCRACDFLVHENYNIEDTRLSPPLELSNRSVDRQPVAAMCIGMGLQPNGQYEMVGKLVPHPKTQQATLLVSNYVPSKDDLSNFKLTTPEDLGWFYPRELSVAGLEEKFNEIYDDLAFNVTQIYGRHGMHFVTDLAYHSVLNFRFDGKTTKGCVETLIVGDSGQGKSEVVQRLQDHYGVGTRFDCKNATVAGILGGMVQMGERWFAQWGIIPTNDQMLVFMEEMKGMPQEVLDKLTDMRSYQVAEITKIGRQWRHQARVRLIGTSNPRSNLSIAQYSYGIGALLELVGAPEDLRRFDIAMIAAKGEVAEKVIQTKQADRQFVEHKYNSDLCRNLVLWAWTRGEDDTKFVHDSTQTVFDMTSDLCKEFTDAIPLVDHGTMRLKLARMSIAVAARTFSHREDNYDTLEVYPCHVEFTAKQIRELYSTEAFGYLRYTAAQKILTTLLSPDELRAAIERTPFPKALIENLLQRDFVELQDVSDWTTYDRLEAQALLSLFVRKYAMLRKGRSTYCKSPKFIEFLKWLLGEPGLPETNKNPERF